jgi:quercetin dioxygenase-like cupin family protein
MGVIRKYQSGQGGFEWHGIVRERYDRAEVADVTKQVLLGPGDGAHNFALRYFEVAAGGASALESHPHDHGVMVLRGTGKVRLGDAEHAIGFGDVVYVAPGELHQFVNTGAEPLGFLCVVPPRP